MSYTPSSLPYPSPTPPSYSATPPAPPPKPTSADARAPPLPPPRPGLSEPSELVGSEASRHPPHSQYLHPQQQPNQPPAPPREHVSVPVVENGWLPEVVRDKTTTDLHALLEDPALQSALLNNPTTTHPAIPASYAHLQPLLTANIALSNSLRTLEETLTQKREATQSGLLALRALEQQHRSKIDEAERALQQFSPMALYQRLSASVAEQENLVRGVEESWLDEAGEASVAEVEGFVRRVREAKRLAFLRRERKERWDEGRVGGWR